MVIVFFFLQFQFAQFPLLWKRTSCCVFRRERRVAGSLADGNAERQEDEAAEVACGISNKQTWELIKLKGPFIGQAAAQGPRLPYYMSTFPSGACVRVERRTLSAASPAQTHILNYDLQMRNGSLIQFMNYVVVMATLIKNRPLLSASNNVSAELRCMVGAARRAARVSAGQNHRAISVLPVSSRLIMSAVQQSHTLRRARTHTNRHTHTQAQLKKKLRVRC